MVLGELKLLNAIISPIVEFIFFSCVKCLKKRENFVVLLIKFL